MRQAGSGLFALVLAVAAQGCATTPEMNRLEGDPGDAGTHAMGLDWPRPVRVGVLPLEDDDLDGFHLQVTSALGEGVDRAVISRGPRTGGRIDYMLRLEYRLRGDPDGVRNFFVLFPGFVIFAPSWAALRSEYDLETRGRLMRVRDQVEVASFERHDRLEVLHTPVGHAVASYLGWAAPVAPPLILAPFITAIVAAAAPWDERAVGRLLARDRAGRAVARDLATQVVQHIDADLRGSRGDGFDGLRDGGPAPDLDGDRGERPVEGEPEDLLLEEAAPTGELDDERERAVDREDRRPRRMW